MIKGEAWKIYHHDRGLIIETSISANMMFIVFAQPQSQSQAPQAHKDNCLLTSAQHTTQLWHRRYGHLNYKDLKTLESKKMVRGLPKLTTTTKLCTDCLIGKHHRDPIPRKSL